MGYLDQLLAGVDNTKRVVGRNMSDMVSDPRLYAEKIVGALRNQNAGVKPVAADGELTNRPLTMEERVENTTGQLDFGGGLGKIVWHGSPHKFDKFDMSKIGTGEGAQAYGHGLYMAESPEVAKSYRDNLTSGLSVKGYDSEAPQEYAARLVKQWGSPEKAMRILDNAGERLPTGRRLEFYNAIKDGSYKQSHEMLPEGSLYKADIPDEAVARFLDWDKPLSQQAPEVRDVLQKMGVLDDPVFKSGNLLGRDVVETLGANASDASQMLQSQGIPGIRYLDGSSRGTGAGTSNYVLFDDQLPRILSRNGEVTGLQPWKPGEFDATINALRNK